MSYLVCVPRALVVIRKRNDGGTNAEDHGRVDFAVRIGSTISILLVLSQIVR